jgi:hypothetical protein
MNSDNPEQGRKLGRIFRSLRSLQMRRLRLALEEGWRSTLRRKGRTPI